MAPVDRCRLLLSLAVSAGLSLSCGHDALQPGDQLARGTWGGPDAGVIVSDSTVHVHIGCTFGDFGSRVTADEDGRFSATGSYVLRAFPIQLGPPLPAQFVGILRGNALTLQVTVNDTVEKRIVIKGPVNVVLGQTPELGPCPICRVRTSSARN